MGVGQWSVELREQYVGVAEIGEGFDSQVSPVHEYADVGPGIWFALRPHQQGSGAGYWSGYRACGGSRLQGTYVEPGSLFADSSGDTT